MLLKASAGADVVGATVADVSADTAAHEDEETDR
jgi:hypothetical protein